MDGLVCQVGPPGGSAAISAVFAVLAFVAIIVGGELFTTGTEWVAVRYELDETTTGSVFSALATTLPETLIPVVAILEGSGGSIGVGAILGGPITLTAFAPILLGATAVLATARGFRDRQVVVDVEQTALDLRVFLVGFALATAAGFVARARVRTAIGVGLVGLYAWYLARVLGGESSDEPVDTEPLELGQLLESLGARSGSAADSGADLGTDPPRKLVLAQVVVAVGLLLTGVELFIDAVRWLAEGVLGTPEAVVALLLAPLVSNVPENVDGIIWVRRGRDVLAVEQLTGTLAFHGTVVVAIGVLFTPWQFDPAGETVDLLLLAAVVVALGSGAVLHWRVRASGGSLRPQLLVSLGLAYVLFVALVLATMLG